MIYINIYYYIYIYILRIFCANKMTWLKKINRLVYCQVTTSLTWKRDEITGGWRVETTGDRGLGAAVVVLRMIGDLHRFHIVIAFIPRIANDFLNPASGTWWCPVTSWFINI